MSGYIIANGDLVQESDIHASYFGRAVKYGDGFFETIYLHETKLLYFHLHFERLSKTARLLQFSLPDSWNIEFFEKQIRKLASANKIKSGRVNIVFSRDVEGKYYPNGKGFYYFMKIESKENNGLAYNFSNEGLNLGEYRELVKNSNFTSTLKTNSALIYVLASLYSHKHKFDECLIFNEFGRVAECISSNIILIKKDKLISPPFSEYGLDGVMKKVIFQKADAYGYETSQYPIFAEDLFAADEIWLSNVMNGLRWVQNYRGKSYQSSLAQQMIALLNKV